VRFLGFLLLLAGWGISLCAVGLLYGKSSFALFVVAGIAVELMGLVFFSRSHAVARGTIE
jgi:hypothetical protein